MRKEELVEKYQELKVMSLVNQCPLLVSEFLFQFVDYASRSKGAVYLTYVAVILLPFRYFG